MALVVGREIGEMFPGMLLVVACGECLDNRGDSARVNDMLEAGAARLKDEWAYSNPQSHPHVAAWRQAYKHMGISGKNFPSSIEALCRRILSGRPVAHINPFVDFYNALSIRYVVPMGGWDLDALGGPDIFLGVTKGGESFTELGKTEAVEVGVGEVSYADTEELITRHFVWRQAEKGKISPATERFFLVSEILPEVGRAVAEEVRRAVVEGLDECFGSATSSDILEAGALRWEFQ